MKDNTWQSFVVFCQTSTWISHRYTHILFLLSLPPIWKHIYVCIYIYQSSSVQSLSCVRLFAIPWTTAHQASLSITNSQSLLKFMSVELGMSEWGVCKTRHRGYWVGCRLSPSYPGQTVVQEARPFRYQSNPGDMWDDLRPREGHWFTQNHTAEGWL